MESARSTLWMLAIAALLHTTGADMVFCGENQQMETVRYETNLRASNQLNSYSSTVDLCQCTVRANGTIFLRSSIQFMTDPGVEELNDTCGPLLEFRNHEARTFVCPTKGESENDTVMTHHLKDQEVISVEVLNSAKTGIQAMISFQAEVFQGSFSLECQQVRAPSSRDICPCNPLAMIGMGNTGFVAASDESLGKRFAIAFGCIIVFLLIFGGLFLLWWKKLRNKGDDNYKDDHDGLPPQQVPVAPHKGHDNPQFTSIKMNPDGEPHLNLALQTPTHSMGSKGLRGSTDSGLYSQGNGQHYANVPGEGDGLPPDMLYTPGLNLSGHADLEGSGVPRSNKPVDVDALYAKPGKGSRPGSRSGSQDHLNAPHGRHPQGQGHYPPGQAYQPRGQGYPQGQGYNPQGHPPQGYHPGHHPYGPGPERVNESFVSDSSHNVSQASINTSQSRQVETDV